MPQQDQGTVRRVLQAALNRLDAESRGNGDGSNPISFTEGDAVTPLILVLAAGSEPEAGYAPTGLNVAAVQPVTASSEQAHAAHPGLERFPLAVSESRSTAPKPCFMEPGRACVSSGACEMRGF